MKKKIKFPREPKEDEDSEFNILEFSIGEMHFKGKSLKPRRILKEVLKDKSIQNYLKGFNQNIFKTPFYVGE